MSSDIGRRAWVTSWTFLSLRGPLFMSPRYALARARATAGRLSRCAVGGSRTRSRPGSAGLADGGHVEPLDPQRRHDDAVEVVAPFARQRGDARAHLGQPAEPADRALVEAEVVHRPGHLAVLEQVAP